MAREGGHRNLAPARDWLFNRLDAPGREAVLPRPVSAAGIEAGAWLAERDLVLE